MPSKTLLICNMGDPNNNNSDSSNGSITQSDPFTPTQTWTLSVLHGVQLVPIEPPIAELPNSNHVDLDLK